jgi:hypothetical protein
MEENKDTAPVKPEVKQYEFAHLVVHCGKCNSKYVLDKDVKGGVQINLPTASNAELVLVCKECKNTMALYYVESDGSTRKEEPKVESAEIEEVIPEVAYEPKMEVVE